MKEFILNRYHNQVKLTLKSLKYEQILNKFNLLQLIVDKEWNHFFTKWQIFIF